MATTKAYPVSAMDFMAPTDWRKPKLAELKAAGGKIIVYHGASDGAFSIQATIDWYEKLRANNGGDASGFARFYSVPSMNHCSGGPATDRFDLFSVLVDWVEHKKAPRRGHGRSAREQCRAAAGLEQDALAAALRVAEGRALSRHRRSRVRGELPMRVGHALAAVIALAGAATGFGQTPGAAAAPGRPAARPGAQRRFRTRR